MVYSSNAVMLAAAGAVGVITAIVHGTLMQRLMIAPIMKLAGTSTRIRGASKRLIPPLLHVSTVDWFLAGLALIAAALWLDGPARVVVSVLAASMYLYAAGASAWATRGRHPGWMLLAGAVVLIALSFRL